MPRWVFYIVAFFVVMLAVDIVFVTLSVNHAPDLVPVKDEWTGLHR